jgi:hypothetical protein
MRQIIASLIILAAFQAPAKALTAEEVLPSCEALIQQLRTLPNGNVFVANDGFPCWYYFTAMQDLSRASDEGKSRILGVCAPPEGQLTQFIRVFIAYANQHPEQTHLPAAFVALAALRAAFPCSQ